LRKNGAHLRHCVWLVASSKFPIPFSLMALLGQHMRPYLGIENADVFAGLGTGDVPALLAAPGQAIASAPVDVFWLRIAAAVWFIGFSTLTVRWLVRWRGVRKILRAAVPTAIAAPVPVNILVSDEVSGNLTLKLAEMPWERAFEIIQWQIGSGA
jgi:hypothetical protein